MKKNSLYLIAISFVASLGGFLFGYDTAIISGCNSFLEAQFGLTSAMLGWVASSALLGTIAVTIIAVPGNRPLVPHRAANDGHDAGQTG